MRHGVYVSTECPGGRVDGHPTSQWARVERVVMGSFSDKLTIDLKSRGKKIFFT